MPRGDGTGPWGQGPMTGRAAGYCAGFSTPGYANPRFGRGLGFGRGRGRGAGFRWRRWAQGPATPPPAAFSYAGEPAGYEYDEEAEKEALKRQAEAMEEQLEAIKRRLDELEE